MRKAHYYLRLLNKSPVSRLLNHFRYYPKNLCENRQHELKSSRPIDLSFVVAVVVLGDRVWGQVLYAAGGGEVVMVLAVAHLRLLLDIQETTCIAQNFDS